MTQSTVISNLRLVVILERIGACKLSGASMGVKSGYYS